MARGKFNKDKNQKFSQRGNSNNKFKHKRKDKNAPKRKFSEISRNHPEENDQKKQKSQKVENNEKTYSSSEESDTENNYNKLLSTFSNIHAMKTSIVSSDESESDEEIENEVSAENESEKLIESEDENSDESIEPEIDEIDNNDNIEDNDRDPFAKHFHFELDNHLLNTIQKTPVPMTNVDLTWPTLGNLTFRVPDAPELQENQKMKGLNANEVFASRGEVPNILKTKKKRKAKLNIKSQIIDHIEIANKQNLDRSSLSSKKLLTDFQTELFSIIGSYNDCLYPQRTFENADEIRFVYCLHALNHILKTRTKILRHNARLVKKDDVPEEYRDQGLVRPKVLIIVPFRDSALKVVNTLINILVPNDKGGQVINKIRFMQDFTGGELAMPKKNPRPDDYEKLFTGNTDDTFRIGLSITKKTLKLYTDFYSSDIIIASPLGLRVIVGAAGEAERDYDFLASVEVLVMDQTEQFLMQNWDHLLHVADHFHMQPKDSHGTDFSRVRLWSLNGLAKYYRQSIIVSSYLTPEINAFFNKRCLNYAGKVKISNPINKGSICQVILQLPHLFQKFNCDNIKNYIDVRFEYFINKVLPQFKDSIMKHTLIYIPSYFDFVRLRNYFKKEELSFVQICEYSKEAKVARARDMFFHGSAHFLLYSERFHHFRRIRLKGIRHIIFYQPPTVPHFYSEMCNFMQESYQNSKSGSSSNMTVTTLYSHFDVIGLAAIVGTQRTLRMCESKQNVHMFMTGE